MIERFRNYFIGGLIAIAGAGGCNSYPGYIDELLVSKKEKAASVCESYGRDQARFEQDDTLVQISTQKEKVLKILGCEPECIEWICGRNDVFEDFKFYGRQNHCGCTYGSLPEAFRSLSEGEVVRLKRALSE